MFKLLEQYKDHIIYDIPVSVLPEIRPILSCEPYSETRDSLCAICFENGIGTSYWSRNTEGCLLRHEYDSPLISYSKIVNPIWCE